MLKNTLHTQISQHIFTYVLDAWIIAIVQKIAYLPKSFTSNFFITSSYDAKSPDNYL